MNDLMIEAARQRRDQVRTRADRPSQRRSAVDGWANYTRATEAGIELRAASTEDRLHFTGHATTYERGYEMWDWAGPYTEIVSAGAGAKSLMTPNLDVPLVLDHESLRRIATTLTGTLSLAEEEAGLLVDAPELDLADYDVAYIAPKLRSKMVTEMSFRFRIIRGQWSPDYTEYRIEEYDIHRGDVAIVGYGANPTTDGGLRSLVAPMPARLQKFSDVAPDHPLLLAQR